MYVPPVLPIGREEMEIADELVISGRELDRDNTNSVEEGYERGDGLVCWDGVGVWNGIARYYEVRADGGADLAKKAVLHKQWRSRRARTSSYYEDLSNGGRESSNPPLNQLSIGPSKNFSNSRRIEPLGPCGCGFQALYSLHSSKLTPPHPILCYPPLLLCSMNLSAQSRSTRLSSTN
jgi:hypothetical protein